MVVRLDGPKPRKLTWTCEVCGATKEEFSPFMPLEWHRVAFPPSRDEKRTLQAPLCSWPCLMAFVSHHGAVVEPAKAEGPDVEHGQWVGEGC